MQIPAAMFIESAADALQKLNPAARLDQQRELQSFGAARAQALGASGLSADLALGYELGLQTARTVLAGSAVLIMKGVDPKEVL